MPRSAFLSATPDPLFPTQVPLREKAAGVTPHRHAGLLMPPPEGIHFLRTPVETACVDSNPDKHRPHLAGNADRCIRGWNGEKYRPGRKCGDEIMLFSLIPLGNPDGLSPGVPQATHRLAERTVPASPHSCARHGNPAAQVLGRETFPLTQSPPTAQTCRDWIPVTSTGMRALGGAPQPLQLSVERKQDARLVCVPRCSRRGDSAMAAFILPVGKGGDFSAPSHPAAIGAGYGGQPSVVQREFSARRVSARPSPSESLS